MSAIPIDILYFHWNKLQNQPLWKIWFEILFEELLYLYSGPIALHWHEGTLGWLDCDQLCRGSGLINILRLWSWFVILILNYTPLFLTLTNTFLTAKCSSDGLHKIFPPLQTSYFDCVLFVMWDWPSGWYCWSFARARTRAEWIHSLNTHLHSKGNSI